MQEEPHSQLQEQHHTTAPVIDPGLTFASVTDKISSIVLKRKTSIAWFFGFAISFALFQLMLLTITNLLFVGRHPYMGLHGDEASFEQLIAEFRFAQGPAAREARLRPVPEAHLRLAEHPAEQVLAPVRQPGREVDQAGVQVAQDDPLVGELLAVHPEGLRGGCGVAGHQAHCDQGLAPNRRGPPLRHNPAAVVARTRPERKGEVGVPHTNNPFKRWFWCR